MAVSDSSGNILLHFADPVNLWIWKQRVGQAGLFTEWRVVCDGI
jgi:hypothetical protein